MSCRNDYKARITGLTISTFRRESREFSTHKRCTCLRINGVSRVVFHAETVYTYA